MTGVGIRGLVHTAGHLFAWPLVIATLVLIPTGSAHSHFKLNLNVRILHVEHLADGMRVYLRSPMPYLVADLVGPEGEDRLPQPAPFTTNALENEQVMHYFDPQQFTVPE